MAWTRNREPVIKMERPMIVDVSRLSHKDKSAAFLDFYLEHPGREPEYLERMPFLLPANFIGGP